MEEIAPICPICHVTVRPSDFFCYNCGKNLHPKPLATDIATQILYYAGSIILPPMGFIWGIRYLKDKNTNAKIIGSILFLITIVELVFLTVLSVRLVNSINDQVNKQLENIQMF
jgi:hypothetical protein